MLRPAVVLLAAALATAPGVARGDGLSPGDLARKPEAGHVTGFPLAAYSVDFGFGTGARVYYYWNGRRDDLRFATMPYVHRVFVQAFGSTGGIQYHWLDYDGPALFHSAFRPRSQLVFARDTSTNYFGAAAGSALRFPGAPDSFGSYDAYTAAQRRVVDGVAYTKYDKVDVLLPTWSASIERSFFNNHARVLAGFGVSYARVRDYTGKPVEALDAAGTATRAPQAPTRFREDCDAGRLVGCAGGRDNYLRIGASYDTRDFEPDPNRGVFVDAEIDVGTAALASEYDYVRGVIAARGYWSPIPDRADLVVAGRALALVQSEGTPFFTMAMIPFAEDPHYGLGGHRTMRGFRQNRFVDHVESAITGELRWTFARTKVRRQQLAFIAVPFVDVGRVFDRLRDVTLRGWRPSAGGAFRISWNLATLVTFDYGVSGEGTGFYVNFGHMF